jgi:hypothetical protein
MNDFINLCYLNYINNNILRVVIIYYYICISCYSIRLSFLLACSVKYVHYF